LSEFLRFSPVIIFPAVLHSLGHAGCLVPRINVTDR
jgi:hypothetical protein